MVCLSNSRSSTTSSLPYSLRSISGKYFREPDDTATNVNNLACKLLIESDTDCECEYDSENYEEPEKN